MTAPARRALAAVLLAALAAGPTTIARAAGEAVAASAPEEAVPGPLRPLAPAAPTNAPATPTPARPAARPPVADVRRPTPGPFRPATQVFVGQLAPLARGELARGRIRFDVATRQLRVDDFAVTDGPELEVALVAADRLATTADVLEAKRVSLGRLKRVKATLVLKVPAEVDASVYRTMIVWSRRDKAPRAMARLLPERGG